MRIDFLNKKENQKDIFYILVLFSITVFLNLPFSKLLLMSADGCIYLDMGRNLFEGKGAISSYNLYQFWPGKYYPYLQYLHPIYPIIAGLTLFLFNLKAVITLNLIFFALNCILLYLILKIYTDRETSFLIALFMAISKTLLFAAIFPWTEHINMLFILFAIFIFLKYDAYFFTGIVLGLDFLVRVPGVFNIMAFVIAVVTLNGLSKDAFKKYLPMACGGLLIIGTYQLFSYIAYGTFYPEFYRYHPSAPFTMSTLFPGATYQNVKPVLQASHFPVTLSSFLKHFRYQLVDFFIAFRNINLSFLLVPCYAGYLLIKRIKKTLFIIFFMQGLAVILGHSVRFTLYANHMFGTTRYSLIAFVTWGSLTFFIIRDLLNYIPKNRVPLSPKKLFLIIFSIFFILEARHYILFRNYYLNDYAKRFAPYKNARAEIADWIQKNTDKEELVASDFNQDGFFLNRPFVSLPQGKARTGKNFFDFINIYHINYLITQDPELIKFLIRMGFNPQKQVGPIALLKRDPNWQPPKKLKTKKTPKQKAPDTVKPQTQNEGSW